jgi:uncharacterized protein (DUF2141 family)
VTITLSGAGSASTTTAANGTYSFTGLAAGTYTITPSLSGYTYSPAAPVVAINSNTVQNFTATSAMTAYSISGKVSYSGTKAGITFIRVLNNGCTGCNTSAGTTISTAPSLTGTSYAVRGLSPGSYVVSAEIDTLGTGAPNESNPANSTSTITITTSNFTGADIIVNDRVPVAPETPNKPSAAPSSGAALIQYKQPRDNNGEEKATSYKIYYGTDTNATTGVPITIPAGDSNNVYLLTGLTDGTQLYVKVTALNVNGESAASLVSQVVTIGATSGSNTVSGSVTFPGTATGPLYVGVYSNTNGVYFQRIASPVSPQAYSFAGIPNGTYQNFAVLDMNGNGQIDAGDLTNFGPNGPPSLAVNTSISGNNLTLTNPNAKTFVATSHQKSGSPDTYGVSLSATAGAKRPVSMTLFSGNNVAVPFDMTAERNNSYNPIYNAGIRPLSTDTYQFLVTFSDGTTQIMSNTGITVLDSFATSLAMNTGAPYSRNVPQLTWAAPSSPPAFYNYSVGLNNANGAQENWNYNGGNNSNGIPSTTTSVVFNLDNSAFPSSSLTTGTTYNWWVQVRDDNGNQAQITTTYMP